MKHDFYVVVWSLTMMAFGAALHDSFVEPTVQPMEAEEND